MYEKIHPVLPVSQLAPHFLCLPNPAKEEFNSIKRTIWVSRKKRGDIFSPLLEEVEAQFEGYGDAVGIEVERGFPDIMDALSFGFLVKDPHLGVARAFVRTS